VTPQQQAEDFTDRVMRMIKPLELPMQEQALIRHTLLYAYWQGYSDCNALWTWQQIMHKGS